MDRTVIQEQAVREVMQEWFVLFSKPQDGFRVELVRDETLKRFLLMTDGWYGYRRSYGPVIDVSLRDGKVWINEDHTEEGIPDQLLEKGVLAEEIVLGWQPEYKRDLTGFAVA